MSKFNGLSLADLMALRDEAKEKAKWAQLAADRHRNAVPDFLAAGQEVIADYYRLAADTQAEIDNRVNGLMEKT